MNTHSSGVDMNDGNNLSIYTELSIFKRESNVVRREILFKDLNQKEQRNLHCLAHDLGLEYEYSLTTSTARISRSGILPALDIGHNDSQVGASYTPDIVDSFQVPGYGDLLLSTTTSESVEGLQATTTAASEIEMDWLNFPQNSTLPPFSSFSTFADELLFNPNTVQEPILFGHENIRHTSKYPSDHQNTTTNSSTRNTSRGRVMPDTPSSPHPPSTSSRPTSPGRVGPLSPYARAAMKAVKDLGACWRCKILRKQCDTEVPCTTCPKTGIATVEPGNWTGVGCRRRELRNEMAKVLLCPNSNPSYGRLLLLDGKIEALTTANKCWQENLKSREEAMESKHALVTSQKTDIDCFLLELELIKPIVEGLRLARIRQSKQELPALFKLDRCILDIIWELSDCSASEAVVGQKNVSDLVVFLRAAALYQAKYGKDQLIANSLECLRSSLEAIKVKALGKLNSSAHYCGKNQCQVNCTSKLDTHLNEYLDELSRVFFKKDNMRNKLWWLSAFYSFTIQSFVRKALIALVDDGTTQPLWAREYLHLPLRLFIAISSKHDPLSKSSDIDTSWVDEETTMEDYETARLLLRPKDNGNQDSADYLKKLFEDNGIPLYQNADFELFSSPAMAVDCMSVDNITNPQIGSFQCTYPGCTAPPFQTQYLLNSHSNIHSSNRPHYCSVKGCPRSEGGKGFKRKNEMIRHGLVHDNPGYVCPFCPDQEHKYPRPDNLQRHVRVHHADKDKDDPQLRDVLSQPREGPSRGRRRRPVEMS